MGKTEQIKAYKMMAVGENDASIDMYGEVVDRHPVDWWTGEPVAGNFIAVDDFLKDLDDLKTKDNITVHINSVGGSLYGGIAIYNRLKSLSANVTTINDGLAASAGSIIFQAGDTRKVHAGSNIMVHQAMSFLYGYYQTRDLKEVIKQLDAGNKAAVNIYAEASGREAAEMKAMVDKETWLTGQDAVDAGLADEVIENEKQISMSLTADKSHMIVNGVSLSTRGMSNIPAGIPILPANYNVSPAATAPMEDKINSEERKSEKVDIKTIEELNAAFPELMAQATTAARAEGHAAGVQAERERLQGIEAIQNAIADSDMIAQAKYGEKPLSAEQLAFKAMQAQAAIGATVLTKMQTDADGSGAADVTADPNGGEPAKVDEAAEAQKEIEEAVKNYNMLNGGKK